MLIYRFLTAIVLIPITLFIIFFANDETFTFLTALLSLAGAWEWSKLMGLQETKSKLLYLLVFAVAMAGIFYVPIELTIIFAFVWWLLATVLIVRYPQASQRWKKTPLLGAMGIVVLIPCWIALTTIRNHENGAYDLLYLFVLIWGADTAAYFAGRKFGRHRLAPLVSPGKSIEGAIGALVCTAVIVGLVCLYLEVNDHFAIYLAIISFSTVIASIVGDLLESMIKREAGVKDSGNLIPGHGGLLDRIDSLTAAAPIFVFMAILFARILE